MQSKRQSYPTIFAIAGMDYLPIQASAVPCERVFSSSAETDTAKRNRTSPILFEALQMLKYDFRKRRLTFAQGTNLNQRILLEDEPDEPGLDAGRLGPHEQAIDDVINSASKSGLVRFSSLFGFNRTRTGLLFFSIYSNRTETSPNRLHDTGHLGCSRLQPVQ